MPFFSDGEGVLECASGSPSGRNFLNILDFFRRHFGLLGSLGDPMGAFRLKDRFWTDLGSFLVTLGRAFGGQGETMNAQNGPQVSPQRLPEPFLGVQIGAGIGETHFVRNCADFGRP